MYVYSSSTFPAPGWSTGSPTVYHSPSVAVPQSSFTRRVSGGLVPIDSVASIGPSPVASPSIFRPVSTSAIRSSSIPTPTRIESSVYTTSAAPATMMGYSSGSSTRILSSSVTRPVAGGYPTTTITSSPSTSIVRRPSTPTSSQDYLPPRTLSWTSYHGSYGSGSRIRSSSSSGASVQYFTQQARTTTPVLPTTSSSVSRVSLPPLSPALPAAKPPTQPSTPTISYIELGSSFRRTSSFTSSHLAADRVDVAIPSEWYATASVGRWVPPVSATALHDSWKERGFTCIEDNHAPNSRWVVSGNRSSCKIVAVVEGSMTVRMGQKEYPMKPGDELLIPARLEYSCEVGSAGCHWFYGHNLYYGGTTRPAPTQVSTSLPRSNVAAPTPIAIPHDPRSALTVPDFESSLPRKPLAEKVMAPASSPAPLPAKCAVKTPVPSVPLTVGMMYGSSDELGKFTVNRTVVFVDEQTQREQARRQAEALGFQLMENLRLEKERVQTELAANVEMERKTSPISEGGVSKFTADRILRDQIASDLVENVRMEKEAGEKSRLEKERAEAAEAEARRLDLEKQRNFHRAEQNGFEQMANIRLEKERVQRELELNIAMERKTEGLDKFTLDRMLREQVARDLAENVQMEKQAAAQARQNHTEPHNGTTVGQSPREQITLPTKAPPSGPKTIGMMYGSSNELGKFATSTTAASAPKTIGMMYGSSNELGKFATSTTAASAPKTIGMMYGSSNELGKFATSTTAASAPKTIGMMYGSSNELGKFALSLFVSPFCRLPSLGMMYGSSDSLGQVSDSEGSFGPRSPGDEPRRRRNSKTRNSASVSSSVVFHPLFPNARVQVRI